ncbi:MAG: 2-amino-4-hydroxy-6-hydroxymethyldihydropteridine diphosphokinase [Rickettsiales bacterium]|jgi:2-amino-4-hydroxy-6-hydroxymethyldihydropteridine diphosphokinase|nr:2-amino-4-hydroxy-6-hydroxymethyldihydropteridine diphosphokinase [Rickettsiales bacterium]
MKTEVVLGLGSNLGDRSSYLESAIFQLEKKGAISNITLSSVHQTKAALLKNSPREWDIDYLNMAVRGTTKLSPEELLSAIKLIERDIGRKNTERWAPREIDIDILAYGEKLVHHPLITIPHPLLLDRQWAITPLSEVYPEWKYPVLGPYYQLTAKELVKMIF